MLGAAEALVEGAVEGGAGIPAGVPALVALPLVAGLGALCGRQLQGPFDRGLAGSGRALTHSRRLLQHLCSIGLVALTYWLWALWNVAGRHHVDGGVVTFMLALLAAVRGYMVAARGSTRVARRHKLLLSAACAVCALDYAAGVALFWRGPWTLRLYCAVGSSWWALAAATTRCLWSSLMEDREWESRSAEAPLL